MGQPDASPGRRATHHVGLQAVDRGTIGEPRRDGVGTDRRPDFGPGPKGCIGPNPATASHFVRFLAGQLTVGSARDLSVLGRAPNSKEPEVIDGDSRGTLDARQQDCLVGIVVDCHQHVAADVGNRDMIGEVVLVDAKFS